jgi:trans-aconitate methyltransferase
VEICSESGNLLGKTLGQFHIHGGCVSAMHIRHVANFCCGIGQAVLTLVNRFPDKTVNGIKQDEARINCSKARFAAHNR